MRKILILGANSAIAQATARLLVQQGDRVFLAGRNPQRLAAVVSDLEVLGRKPVPSMALDLNLVDRHEELLDAAERALGGLDGVLLAQGELGKQELAQKDYAATRSLLETNLLAPISLLTRVANRFEARRAGIIAVISSVAGDRGRMSNYVYGTAKGGLSIFLSGLRNRLFHAGVHVVTVKPGFVDTPMTAEFKKGPLWATPEKIARGIVRAMDRKRDVVYLPGFWRLIMLVICSVPERVFKKLKL
jgi:decaprenylphospho-beta-D-erythro-pentofuranosid-2-ulose 2-reductase